MNAGQIVGQIRSNEGVFDVPLLDGFPDDDPRREGTKILPLVNKAYKDLTWEGMKQCYVSKTLQTGTDGKYLREFAYPKNITMVYAVEILDPTNTNKVYSLARTSRNALTIVRSNFQTAGARVPTKYYFGGGFIGFDYTPDKAYTIRILADVLPTELVNRTDVPDSLEDFMHEGLVVGGEYYLSRPMLRRPDMNEYKRQAHNELKDEWENWIKRAKEIWNARSLNTSSSPMVDEYRLMDYVVYWQPR